VQEEYTGVMRRPQALSRRFLSGRNSETLPNRLDLEFDSVVRRWDLLECNTESITAVNVPAARREAETIGRNTGMYEMIEPGAMRGWDDLAEELGLPPETSAAPAGASSKQPAEETAPAPVPAAHAPEPVPTDKEDAPPSRGRRRRSPPTPAVLPEEEPAQAEQMEQPAAPAIESVEVSVPPEEPALEAGAGQPPVVEGGEEPPSPRGRSRRRRRGRGSKSAAADAVSGETPIEAAMEPSVEGNETAPPEAEREEESDQHPRRRRSRGRPPEREEAPRATVKESDEDSPELEEEDLEPAARDEEVDDLSNWNVPTWSELIASLYRPER
jgi:hypothetical protein